MIRHIYVRNTFEAIHSWPDALPDVDFLKHDHRHIFFIKTTFNVDHNDRDKEFFIMQRRVKNFLISKYPIDQKEVLPRVQSCEQVAEDILMHFKDKGIVSCEVSEDAEN